MKRFGKMLLFAIPVWTTAPVQADAPARALVEESIHRHAPPPFLYEEQTFVLSDARGRISVRAARHYVRQDGETLRRRLVIEAPAESRGVSLDVVHAADGRERRGATPATTVFGSDFTVADLEGEPLQESDYDTAGTQDIDRVPHHLVRAWPRGDRGGRGERRLYLRKDNLFVTRIDTLDAAGRLVRRMSFRDPQPDESGAWRPGMILLEDLANRRRSLLRIERRVHSSDYVPASVFVVFQ